MECEVDSILRTCDTNCNDRIGDQACTYVCTHRLYTGPCTTPQEFYNTLNRHQANSAPPVVNQRSMHSSVGHADGVGGVLDGSRVGGERFKLSGRVAKWIYAGSTTLRRGLCRGHGLSERCL